MPVKPRYRSENGKVVVDIVMKDPRQLFDARDPAPFRERDLDDDAVQYIMSSIQEFAIKTPMKLMIHFSDPSGTPVDETLIKDAVHSFFDYEADGLRRRLSKTLRTGRFFLVLGVITLMTCLGLAEILKENVAGHPLLTIIREGLVISGWVAMWRPIELFLYDWWPLAEQKRYCEKLASLEIIVSTGIVKHQA